MEQTIFEKLFLGQRNIFRTLNINSNCQQIILVIIYVIFNKKIFHHHPVNCLVSLTLRISFVWTNETDCLLPSKSSYNNYKKKLPSLIIHCSDSIQQQSYCHLGVVSFNTKESMKTKWWIAKRNNHGMIQTSFSWFRASDDFSLPYQSHFSYNQTGMRSGRELKSVMTMMSCTSEVGWDGFTDEPSPPKKRDVEMKRAGERTTFFDDRFKQANKPKKI